MEISELSQHTRTQIEEQIQRPIYCGGFTFTSHSNSPRGSEGNVNEQQSWPQLLSQPEVRVECKLSCVPTAISTERV